MSNAVIEGTGGVVPESKFSDDIESEAMSLDYRGEYDERGRFIMDDDVTYEKEFKQAAVAAVPEEVKVMKEE